MLLLHCLCFRERFAGSHGKVPDSPTRLDPSHADTSASTFSLADLLEVTEVLVSTGLDSGLSLPTVKRRG